MNKDKVSKVTTNDAIERYWTTLLKTNISGMLQESFTRRVKVVECLIDSAVSSAEIESKQIALFQKHFALALRERSSVLAAYPTVADLVPSPTVELENTDITAAIIRTKVDESLQTALNTLSLSFPGFKAETALYSLVELAAVCTAAIPDLMVSSINEYFEDQVLYSELARDPIANA